MSGAGPWGGSGGGNPFESLFGELAKLFSNQGAINLQIARQMAQWLATEGQPELNVDPLERMQYDQLLRVAELQVGNSTGLGTSLTGSVVTVRPVTRGEWASRTLDAYAPLLEGGALAIGKGVESDRSAQESDSEELDVDHDKAAEEMLGGMAEVIGPLLVGLQAGSLVGHLAQRAFGQYHLPVPRPVSDELLVVPRSVNDFASEWGLSVEDVRLWVCVSELTHHVVIGQPHVRERMEGLLRRYAGGFKLDLSALEEKLADVDPRDPSSFQAALGDPAQLLGAMRTPGQQQALDQIAALVSVIEGYVDHVVDKVGRHLIASWVPLMEAMRRRRAEPNEVTRLIEGLLGLEFSRAQQERGAAFVRGVLERAGDEGLARLWHSERELPTPAEVDAPGLWLERIDLPE